MAFYNKVGINWFKKTKKSAIKLESYDFFQKTLISGKKKTFSGQNFFFIN